MKHFTKLIFLFIVFILPLLSICSCDNKEEESSDAVFDSRMTYNVALVRINNASSYIREDTYRTEITQDGVTTVNEQSFIDKYSFNGVGNNAVSFTFPNAEYGEFTLSFCENKAYVETESNCFSFDCTIEEFYAITQRHMNVWGFVTNIDVFTMFSYDAVCERDEAGYYFISISRLIFDENTKEILLGSGYEFYSEFSQLNLEATIIINPNLCFEQILTDITFSANTETGRADFTIHNKVSFSEIGSKTVYVDIPTYNCEHIGGADVLAGLDAYKKLNSLAGYSASLTGEYFFAGEDTVHNDVLKTDFVIENGEKQKFAQKSVYDCEDGKNSRFIYFEDGTLYLKYNENLQYTDYGDNVGRYQSLNIWIEPWFDINAGKGFSLAENGDGTATLSYEYDDRLVKQLILDYFNVFYGGQNLPASVEVISVEKAVAHLTYNIDKCIVTEHTYEIEATVEIDGSTFVYKENRLVTVDTDNFTVPDRSVFLGTSDF